MGWVSFIVLAAGLASMRAAMQGGDIDEAARQGVLAGPEVIDAGLVAADRPARFAAIAAAPSSDGRIDHLSSLAQVARGPDRRVAIPAARAARQIARELAKRDLPDDLAPVDLAAHRTAWGAIAVDPARWIEVRVLALDVASSIERLLDRTSIGIDARAALADPDPAFRRAALAVMPMPVPAALRPLVAHAVANDLEPAVALVAAAILCADLTTDPARPIIAALGPDGVARIRTLVAQGGPRATIRDASRCLRARAQ